MARLLFTTFGSYGDLFPYLAVGTELRRRGHHVAIATSTLFREQVEREGLGFHAVRPDVSFDDREMIAYVMDPRRGSERLIRYLTSLIRESYEDFLAAAESADAILTHPATPAAVLVAQKLHRISWISSVLAPLSFFSAYDPPVFAPAPWVHGLRFLGPGFMRAILALAKRHSISWVRPILDFRRELGISDTGHPLFESQHSPLLVLALFSQRIAMPQPDWPARTAVTGFPFFDRGGLTPELGGFLAAGPAPVVFTLGSSAVGAARDFYVHSLSAIERLCVRAIFLTGSHPQGLPDKLPEGALALPYAPHGALFERASAIVHQGGIGTTAQALRAGRPMLVVPFAHDQYDNAERVRRLSVAEVLPHAKYLSRSAEQILQRLLGNPAYRTAAATLGEQVRAENGSSNAADAIEVGLSRL
jgi:rhamnosyltransferase subunit B